MTQNKAPGVQPVSIAQLVTMAVRGQLPWMYQQSYKRALPDIARREETPAALRSPFSALGTSPVCSNWALTKILERDQGFDEQAPGKGTSDSVADSCLLQ